MSRRKKEKSETESSQAKADETKKPEDSGTNGSEKKEASEKPGKKRAEARDLRKMSRIQLIEIIYALQEDAKVLDRENAELREKLNVRYINMEHYGSIAEAALGIQEVFEQAQKAADLYVDSIKKQVDEDSQNMAEDVSRFIMSNWKKRTGSREQ